MQKSAKPLYRVTASNDHAPTGNHTYSKSSGHVTDEYT